MCVQGGGGGVAVESRCGWRCVCWGEVGGRA